MMNMNTIDNKVQKITEEDYKVMIGLEDVFFYDEDKEAGKELTKMCKKYGLTRKAFVDWCEELV